MKRRLKWRNRGAIVMLVVAAVLGCIVGVADACPPPTIMFKPADATRSAVVRFSFHDAQRGGVTFVCSLDGSGAHPCASPTTYSGLPAGRHTFSVVARSGAGTSLSTSYAWTIDRRPPSISIGFPRTGSAYCRPVWSAGCARRQGGVCGTAFDSVGVDSVRVSIKQNAT